MTNNGWGGVREGAGRPEKQKAHGSSIKSERMTMNGK